MYQKITVRRGATFRRAVTVSKPGANPRDKPVPVDITGWAITATVKKDASVIASLTVNILDAPNGKYQLYLRDTSAWPLGDLSMDICYEMADTEDGEQGDIVYTPTATINVTRTETARPAP